MINYPSDECNNDPFHNECNNDPFHNECNNDPFHNECNNNNPFNNEGQYNNPFNNEGQYNNDMNNNFIEEIIEIWIEQFGKKKNTYISGWKLPDKELKEHIKIFKKSHGCNGTLKINDDNIKVVMFQGDHIDNVISYLEKLGIDVNNINIKGYDT